jgi:hypothetical protein
MRRQAGGILGCFIAFFIWGHSALGMQSFWSAGKEEQKLGCASLVENVFVDYPSAGVESSSTIIYDSPLVICYWIIIPRYSMEHTSRAHMSYTWKNEFSIIKPDDLRSKRVDCNSAINIKGNIISGGLSSIFESDFGPWIGSKTVLQDGIINEDISPQLPNGSFLGTLYEPSSGPPQSNGREEQQARKEHQKRVSNFETPIEYRPKFGSLIAAIAVIGLGLAVCGSGMSFWDSGRRWRGSALLLFGMFLGFYGPISLLFSWDPWSLLERLL